MDPEEVCVVCPHLCVTGVVRGLTGERPASGATHRLLGAGGEVLLLLRSHLLTLDRFDGRLARLCGIRRGRVMGEAAPLLEVTDGVPVDDLPLTLGPFVAGSQFSCAEAPLRPAVAPRP